MLNDIETMLHDIETMLNDKSMKTHLIAFMVLNFSSKSITLSSF